MADLGSDFSGTLDLDPALRQVSGQRALAEAVVRRITTPRGSFPDFPDYGFDVESLIGSTMTDSAIRQRITEQAQLEEEVKSCRVTIARNFGAVEISIALKNAEGPFSLTVNVSELGVTAIIPNE